MSELTITAAHEWCGHDAFGSRKRTDAEDSPPSITGAGGSVCLTAPRNGYASFRILIAGSGSYTLTVSDTGPVQADLFKAWYHRVQGDDGEAAYLPDALVPVDSHDRFALPDPDNAVPGQTHQEFWVDLFVPADTEPATVDFSISVSAAGTETALSVALTVLPALVPEKPSLFIDHNSYGTAWLARLYSVNQDEPAAVIDLLHNYYRLVREHRGLFHNLGQSHSGSVPALYAPGVRGRARDLTLVDWELYDRHLGPLLDGSAFASPAPGAPPVRRSPRPLESVYAPFTPNWPASYVHWAERGYEVELSRGLRQFDDHLAQRGWLSTRMEFFFNHKKRYRWYAWDGDEVKYPEDFPVHDEFSRIFHAATADSRAPWLYRFDASWQMEAQFKRYAGRRNFWVLGGMHRWFPAGVQEALDRGEIVWWYGGLPPLQESSTAILDRVYETWARGLEGFCLWLTTGPDEDPWFDCRGNATANLYPGERFGIPGPIPSIRLKVQRNGIQDIDLASQAQGREPAERIRTGMGIPLWTEPPAVARATDPSFWDSANLAEEHEPVHQSTGSRDPFRFQLIRDAWQEARP
jgi:hypothetical protein